MAEIVGGGTPSTGIDSYWDGDIDWYAPTEIGEQIYLKSSQRKITEEGLNKSSAKILPIGTVLFTSRAGIGKTAILLKEGCTNQGFQSIVPNKEKLDSYFIFTRSEELKRYGETVGSGSTFVEVSGKQMANMELMMPKTMLEQQQIGEYYQSLDNLITLHQRKLYIFMKKAISVWEQRKVGDYLTESREIGNKGDVAHKMTVKLWGKGVYEKLEVGSTNTQYFIRHANQFIYSKLDFLNCAFGVVPEELESLETTADVPAFDCVDMNPYFMFYRAIQPSFYIQNGIIANGSRKAKRIHADTFLEMPISVPELTEQNKIVEYFQSLDDLITLHHRKFYLFIEKDIFAWEQRKFGSLLEETRNRTTVEDEDTLLSCAIDGMYLNSELFSHFRGSSNIGYLKIKKNDLILSAQNLHLGNCNVNLRFEHGIISPAYKVYELVGCNPLFMQAWVKKDSTKDFFLKASTEGASVCRKNIVWEELYKQELPIPNIEEQTKIGEYFNSLDHLITLHQRKRKYTKYTIKYTKITLIITKEKIKCQN